MVRRLNGYPDDSVSELLRALKVHSTVYCISDLLAPWGFEVEDSIAAKFHLVLEGSCVLMLRTGEQESLRSGDLVVLPAGTGYRLTQRCVTLKSLQAHVWPGGRVSPRESDAADPHCQ